MAESPEMQLIAVFRKYGGLALRGLISGPEFTNKAFDEFAYIDRVYPEIVPALWEAVPAIIRGAFADKLREATRPEFRWHPFYIGGGRPMTEEELRRDADLRTSRVQAWALEFVEFLAGALAGTDA